MGVDVRVLCFNAGSSSLKVALIEVGTSTASRLVVGAAALGRKGAGSLQLIDVESGKPLATPAGPAGEPMDGPAAAVRAVRDLLEDHGIAPPEAIGHRLVHGGPDQTAPLRITTAARERLERAIPFAPLHLPAELEVVDATVCAYPRVPQIACFDTSFHATLPDVARRLPFAGWVNESGIRRYGFHGLSYEYVCSRLGEGTLDYAVIAHLGSGASMAAVHRGRSIDTTMGMSPTGGLMMGTRTGDVDPGALIYLMDQKKWGAREVEQLVNRESGLLGVSETTSDMPTLLASREHDPRARLAIELFVYAAAKTIGALAVALGELRTLVFTGGIGAHSAVVRAEIASRLSFLGVSIDATRNLAHAAVVSPPGASCTVHVLETDEEMVIARHAHRHLG